VLGVSPSETLRERSFSFGDATGTELWFFQRDHQGLRLIFGAVFQKLSLCRTQVRFN
jgi:hypothetical protein